MKFSVKQNKYEHCYLVGRKNGFVFNCVLAKNGKWYVTAKNEKQGIHFNSLWDNIEEFETEKEAKNFCETFYYKKFSFKKTTNTEIQ